ncbi:hypothetical protein [Agromyces sp. SYSU T00266]|uniref:hypothetical protein n=1 Tax=Agromyces zhanjiangensis TaxID=3158562 RepID=UPI0033911652
MSDSLDARTGRTRIRGTAIAAVTAALGLILAATTAVAPASAAKPVKGGTASTVYDCGFFHDRTVTAPKVAVSTVALRAGEVIGVTVSPARAGDDVFLVSNIGLNITFAGGPATEGFRFTAPVTATYGLSFSLRTPEGSTAPDGLTWKFTCSTGPSAMTGAPMPTASDSDRDGVTDTADLCPSTAIPESVRKTAGKYYATTGGKFVDGAGKGSGLTVIDTAGCNAAQIASKLKLSGKDARGGITLAQLTDWANTH